MRNRNVIPSLDLLQGFEAAARHLSFTKAGEELFLTQSAVSRQIKDLEDQLVQAPAPVGSSVTASSGGRKLHCTPLKPTRPKVASA